MSTSISVCVHYSFLSLSNSISKFVKLLVIGLLVTVILSTSYYHVLFFHASIDTVSITLVSNSTIFYSVVSSLLKAHPLIILLQVFYYLVKNIKLYQGCFLVIVRINQKGLWDCMALTGSN